MKYFKLIDAIDVPKNLSIVRRNGSMVRYGSIRLDPGKKYELLEEDVMNQLVNATEKTGYTPDKERRLKETGASYEKKYCKSCGGRVLKLEYKVIEVKEDAEA